MESGRCRRLVLYLHFFLGLIAIWIWDKWETKKRNKIIVVVLLCVLSLLGDWSIWDVLWPLFFFIYRNDEKKMWDSFLIIAAVEIIAAQLLAIFLSDCAYGMLFQFGALRVMPLIKYCYNGKPGSRHMFHRWFFYVFYPLHLLLLFLLKLYLHG